MSESPRRSACTPQSPRIKDDTDLFDRQPASFREEEVDQHQVHGDQDDIDNAVFPGDVFEGDWIDPLVLPKTVSSYFL